MTRKSVLVVEDHDDLRHVFAECLKAGGFDVREASDGPAALRMVELNPPDLVLLDVVLPTLDGYSVRDEIAANARTQDIPVVVVTGAPVNVARLKAVQVLRKPVDPRDVVAAVRGTLAVRAGRRHGVERADSRRRESS